MKIEKTATLITHPTPAAQVLAAGTIHPAGGGGVWRLHEHEKIKPLLPSHIDRAIAWLEERHGVVCHQADHRLTFPEKSRPALILPLWPATLLHSVTRDGKPMDGWGVKNGKLWHPTARFHKKAGAELVAMVRFGFEKPKHIPHLVLQSIAILCHAWMNNANEDAMENAEIGVGQLLAVYRPNRTVEERSVSQWL